MDDATSEIYSALFVEQEGTMSTFSALDEVIGERGLFCALYADRGSHYWHTPKAGGKVDRDNPTQVGRALGQLGVGALHLNAENVTKALPGVTDLMAKRALCAGTKVSFKKRLASSIEVIPARRISWGKRFCKVPNMRRCRPD